MIARRALAPIVALAVAAAAAPKEILRDEAGNFRLVGELPKGWKRDGAEFTYSIEEIPHAFVRFTAARVARPKDPAALLGERAPLYRFPNTPPGPDSPVREAIWAGQPAWTLELRATSRGVACLRRVTVMWAKGVWYERIETVFGDLDEEVPFSDGARVLRDGFRLLAPPLPAPSPEVESYEDADTGWRLRKPEGWLRRDDLADTGLRLAFERSGVLVRLFDYGPHEARFELKLWMDQHYRRFEMDNPGAERAAVEAPAIEGAEALAERHLSTRDGRALVAHVVLIRTRSGSLLAIRASTHGGTAGAAADAAQAFLSGLEVSG